MRINELMLYKHMEDGHILQDMAFLIENYKSDYYNQEDLKGLLYECVNRLLEMAVAQSGRVRGIGPKESPAPVKRETQQKHKYNPPCIY